MRLLLLTLALLACNRRPEAPEVTLGPEAPTTVDDLVITVVSGPTDRDADDAPTTTVRWTRDGEAVDAYDDALTLPAAETARGQVWEATVGATDGRKDAEPVVLTATIVNAAPTVAVTLGPDGPRTTDDLVPEVTTEDPDGDEVTLGYRWILEGQETPATSETLPSDLTEKGQVWTVRVIAADTEGASGSAEAEIEILNTVPTVFGATIEPTRLTTTTDATCQGVAWADPDSEDPETYEVSWQVNGSDAGTGATLSSDAFRRYDKVRCILTPVDDESAGEPVRSFAVDVANTRPQILGYEVSPDAPTSSDTLEARVTSFFDADGDIAVPIFTWEVEGDEVSEASFLRPEAFEKGDEVQATIRLFDGIDQSGGAFWTRIIANSPPTAPEVAIGPGSPTASDTLTCSVVTESTDVDGDTVSYAFAWTIGGTTVGTEASLPASATSAGDTVTCTATPDDGDDTGPAGVDTVTL